MGERTQYTPGTFSWADLTTTDQEAAKRFYSGLFGWEAEDMPAGEGVVYSMMNLDGKPVAAISPQPPQQRDAGVPPTWNSYVTVHSADATLARARELGATVHADAFDVFEAGRMGVVQDPQGAFLLVWEPRQHIGASLVNIPGAITWNELASPDLGASTAFYSQLFDWTTEAMQGGDTPYLTINNSEGALNGGMRPVQPSEPPHWLVYFGTADLDAAVAQVESLGGGKLVGPMEVPTGKFAVVRDPQGAVFALFAGEFDE